MIHSGCSSKVQSYGYTNCLFCCSRRRDSAGGDVGEVTCHGLSNLSLCLGRSQISCMVWGHPSCPPFCLPSPTGGGGSWGNTHQTPAVTAFTSTPSQTSLQPPCATRWGRDPNSSLLAALLCEEAQDQALEAWLGSCEVAAVRWFSPHILYKNFHPLKYLFKGFFFPP